jgi:hypothetical protein
MMNWLKRAWTRAKACWRYSRQFWPKASQAVLVVASLILAGLLVSVLASMIQMLLPYLLLAGFLALWVALTPEMAAPRVS